MIHQRTLKAHFYLDTIYNIFGSGKEEKKCTEILHEFTGTVIWRHSLSFFALCDLFKYQRCRNFREAFTCVSVQLNQSYRQ